MSLWQTKSELKTLSYEAHIVCKYGIFMIWAVIDCLLAS